MKIQTINIAFVIYTLALFTFRDCALYGQSLSLSNTATVRSISPRFSVEGTFGVIPINSDESGRDFFERNIRAFQLAIEPSMRFSLQDDVTSLYVGVHIGIVGDRSERKPGDYFIYTPSTGVQKVSKSTTIQGSWALHGGIEANLGWLRSRSTIGAGLLYSRIDYTLNGGAYRDNNFAWTLRQSFTRDIGAIYLGAQFQQTFSHYDNFSTIGLVAGIRF